MVRRGRSVDAGGDGALRQVAGIAHDFRIASQTDCRPSMRPLRRIRPELPARDLRLSPMRSRVLLTPRRALPSRSRRRWRRSRLTSPGWSGRAHERSSRLRMLRAQHRHWLCRRRQARLPVAQRRHLAVSGEDDGPPGGQVRVPAQPSLKLDTYLKDNGARTPAAVLLPAPRYAFPARSRGSSHGICRARQGQAFR